MKRRKSISTTTVSFDKVLLFSSRDLSSTKEMSSTPLARPSLSLLLLEFFLTFYASWLDVELKAPNKSEETYGCVSRLFIGISTRSRQGLLPRSLRIEYPKENRVAFDFQRGNDILLSLSLSLYRCALAEQRSSCRLTSAELSFISLACPGISVDNLTPSSVGACLEHSKNDDKGCHPKLYVYGKQDERETETEREGEEEKTP